MTRGARAAGLVRVILTLAGLMLLMQSTAFAKVPSGFFGVVPQGQLEPRDFERMRHLRLVVRAPIYWFEAEPERGRLDLSATDELVGDAAAKGIQVVPFVYGTPPWLSADHARPPLGSAASLRAWRGFIGSLVARYGPDGSFWAGKPSPRPIRRWQIWNEPNFPLFWQPRPSPVGYARLLDIAAGAIRSRDPAAQILAAGVAPIEGEIRPWEFLRRLYRVPGVKRDFDIAALHPYSASVAGVRYQIDRTRQVMASAGAVGVPLLLSELGVASGARVPTPMNRGRRGQARFLERALGMLVDRRREWGIAGVDWFAWQDGPDSYPHCVFCEHAGLFEVDGTPKPSWGALRRAILRAGTKPVR